MTLWAGSGKFGNAVFLCICVDPDARGTAVEFSQLYFGAATGSLVNGYIDKRSDFPDFQAQLGCQGFTIFDASHKMVAQKTLPWVQYRNDAFRDVEVRLSQLCGPARVENPLGAPVGQSVRVVGLSSEAGVGLNGLVGEVTGSSENGRYMVKLADGTKAFRPENLQDATGAPVGKRVRVAGLSSEKGKVLNGQVGEVVGGTANGRLLVKLPSGTTALRPENMEAAGDGAAPAAEAEDEEALLRAIPSVEHEDMDDQHESCIEALRLLVRTLSVQSLKSVRDELRHHFEEEEVLLRQSGFGGAAAPGACGCSGDNGGDAQDFSAMGSHVKDHKRIIALAEDALASLSNACESGEGSVPKAVATSICRAFADHATGYDALYAGKVAAAGA